MIYRDQINKKFFILAGRDRAETPAWEVKKAEKAKEEPKKLTFKEARLAVREAFLALDVDEEGTDSLRKTFDRCDDM